MICQLLAAMRRALAFQREGLDLIAFINRRSTQPRRGRLSPSACAHVASPHKGARI
jgi:hypothetical protein